MEVFEAQVSGRGLKAALDGGNLSVSACGGNDFSSFLAGSGGLYVGDVFLASA